GEDGLGGIFPAMANAAMMFDCLGYGPDHPGYASALASLRKLLVLDGERSYCQPCLCPVWDTSLACHSLIGVEDIRLSATLARKLDWSLTYHMHDYVDTLWNVC